MKVRQPSKQQSSLVGIILYLSTLTLLGISTTIVKAEDNPGKEEAKISGSYYYDELDIKSVKERRIRKVEKLVRKERRIRSRRIKD